MMLSSRLRRSNWLHCLPPWALGAGYMLSLKSHLSLEDVVKMRFLLSGRKSPCESKTASCCREATTVCPTSAHPQAQPYPSFNSFPVPPYFSSNHQCINSSRASTQWVCYDHRITRAPSILHNVTPNTSLVLIVPLFFPLPSLPKPPFSVSQENLAA